MSSIRLNRSPVFRNVEAKTLQQQQTHRSTPPLNSSHSNVQFFDNVDVLSASSFDPLLSVSSTLAFAPLVVIPAPHFAIPAEAVPGSDSLEWTANTTQRSCDTAAPAASVSDWLHHSGLLRGLCGLSAFIGVHRVLGLPIDWVALTVTFYLYWAAYVGDHLKDCR